jgi:hypothetical protein
MDLIFSLDELLSHFFSKKHRFLPLTKKIERERERERVILQVHRNKHCRRKGLQISNSWLKISVPRTICMLKLRTVTKKKSIPALPFSLKPDSLQPSPAQPSPGKQFLQAPEWISIGQTDNERQTLSNYWKPRNLLGVEWRVSGSSQNWCLHPGWIVLFKKTLTLS